MYDPEPKSQPRVQPRNQPKATVPSYIRKDGQVANWLFYNGAGDVLFDFSGEKNHGDIIGPQWTDEHSASWGLDFDGVDDYIQVSNPGSFNFGTADFTITAWIRRGATGVLHDLVTKTASGTWEDKGKQFILRSDDTLGFDAYGVGTVSSSGTIGANTWYHVAVTYDNGTDSVKLYINGKQDGSGTLALTADDPDHVVRIGQKANSNYFEGESGVVRFWQRVLPGDEIETKRKKTKPLFTG